MKRLLFILLLLPFLSRAQGPISYAEAYRDSYFDDTATLQALLNAGNVTLTRNYNISGSVTVTYLLHGAGYTISTSQTTGVAIILGSSGAGIDHTTVSGSWNYATTAPNSAGNYAISMRANNTTIAYDHITQFPGFGINCQGSISNLSVTHNLIDKVGYIGFYFDPESNTTGHSSFSNNMVDKSMLNPANVTQLAVGIRGAVNAAGDTTFNWTIANDTLKMPLNTTSTTECIEVRNMKSSSVTGLVCSGASIGISVVKCTRMAITGNRMTGNNAEGLEIGNVQYSYTSGNSVTTTTGVGILIDGGATPCFADTLNNDTARVTGHIGLQLYTNTNHIIINGVYVTHTTQGVYCLTSDSIYLVNPYINGGSHSSSVGIYTNGGYGNIFISRGHIINNTYAVYSANSGVNQLVDHIIGISVHLTGTPTQFGSSFSNGAHYGTNVYFVSGTLTFGAIPSKVYGAADFSPGASSTLPVTYTSSNTSIATIVSNNVHVLAVGTVNITASNGDSTAVQPATITKAMLTITADNKRKAYKAANPSFTASYSGWKYGETTSALTTLPTATTTAGTLSLPGNYFITVNGAAANNYNFTYNSGILTITSVGHGIRFRPNVKLK